MPAVIEVTSTIQHSNSELAIRISGEIKGDAESRLREIRSILAQAKAVFTDENGIGGADAKPLQKGSLIPSSSGQISDRMARMLRWHLFNRQVDESDFCKVYGISCIEELTQQKANRIINDLAAKR